MTDLITTLQKLEACDEAVKWAGEKDPKAAWAECQRGDWLLWIAAKLEIDRRLIVLAACDCAETALKFVPEGEDRPAKAIETVRAWVEGKATLEQVKVAADAAYSAYSADAAYAADDDARDESFAHSAQLVRDRIPFSVIENALLQDKGDK